MPPIERATGTPVVPPISGVGPMTEIGRSQSCDQPGLLCSLTSVRATEDWSTVAPFSRSTGAAAACDLVERQADREPCPDGFMHRQRDVAGRIAQKVVGAPAPGDGVRALIYRDGRIGRENNQITSVNHHVFLGRAGSNGQIQVTCRYT